MAIQRPKRMRKLTHERIVEKALELVREEGVDQLHMRRLGRELGVDASAIYWHFESKKDLVAAVLTLNGERVELELPPAGPWRERCRSLGQAIRQRIRENPQVITLSEGVDALASFNMRCNGLMIRILWEAGFAGKEAILASQSLVSVVVKFAEIEIEAEASMPPPEAVRELAQAAAAREEGGASERLLDMASAYAELTVHDLFDYALERLLDGVETNGRAHHPPSP